MGETVRQGREEVATTRQEICRRLGEIAEAILEDARRLLGQLGEGVTDAERTLGEHLKRIVPLVEQVVDQTAHRVFGGKTVPAAEKLVSLVEPHPAISVRGKADRAVDNWARP